MKIKKGDMVKIMAGKDKGKTGKVSKVIPAEEKNNNRRDKCQEKEYEAEKSKGRKGISPKYRRLLRLQRNDCLFFLRQNGENRI